MARPSNRPGSKRFPEVLGIPEGLEVKEFRLGPIEDKAERAQRLWKEKLSFIVRDLLSYIVAFSIIVGAMIYSF